MAQQRLNGTQVHSSFQKVRCKAVTNSVDPFAFVDLGFLFGEIVYPLGVVNRNRTALSVGKKPRWGTMLFPIRAQF